jgi:hypothetical protein
MDSPNYANLLPCSASLTTGPVAVPPSRPTALSIRHHRFVHLVLSAGTRPAADRCGHDAPPGRDVRGSVPRPRHGGCGGAAAAAGGGEGGG